MSTILDYAAPPPRHRAILRRALIIGSFVFLCLSVLLSAKWVTRTLTYHYWLNRALNYRASPGQLVLDATLTKAFFYSPPEVSHMGDSASLATIFLHGMCLPGRDERLVIVTADYSPPLGQRNSLCFFAEVVPIMPSGHLEDWPAVRVTVAHHCQIFAGQPDPSNAAHFTFVCEIDGTKHLYDGWLQQNDGVLIAERKPLVAVP